MTAKLKEALDRLATATKQDFPWHVRLQLMNEAVICLCEDQYELHNNLAARMGEMQDQLRAIAQAVGLEGKE